MNGRPLRISIDLTVNGNSVSAMYRSLIANEWM